MTKASILFLLLLAVGVILRFFILSESTKTFADGDKVRFQTRLLTSAKIEKGLQKFQVTPKGYTEVRVITGGYPRWHYGERVQIAGVVQQSTLQNGENLTTLYFPQIERVEDGSMLFGITRNIRLRVEETFSGILPPTSASLLLGIVFGVKEGIPKDFETALQSTGVFHVIAASGMNVSMLGGFLMALLSRILRRQIAILICIVSIVFYTILAGLEPSILRAALMATIAFSALLLGRQGTALWSLTLTALLMLLYDPFLYADIGFQLSFAATLGILLIKPLLHLEKRGSPPESSPGVEPLKNNILEKNPTLALLSEDLGSTISAQIATVPILLFYFHQYGLLSIPINALILWTIPPLMVIGSVSALVSFLLPSVASVMTLCALPFLWLFETVVMTFEPYNSVFEIETLSPLPVALYYVLLGGVILLKRHRTREKVLP